MSGCKRFLATLALWGAMLAAPAAWALEAEPAAGGQVAPGDSIAYTYTLTKDMQNCVLRLALAPGLTVREDSVQVKGNAGAEVVYGSDGFVVMADALAEGDTVVFVAEVGNAALEAWARMTSADGSITEEDGYASHRLALPNPAQEAEPGEAGQAAGAPAKAGVNPIAQLALFALLALAVLGLVFREKLLGWLKKPKALMAATATPDAAQATQAAAGQDTPASQAAAPSEAQPKDASQGQRQDDTVEYLTIPGEEGSKAGADPTEAAPGADAEPE